MLFEIFKTFFLLGWISFGGPAAHIGYFRREFVEKRGWLSEQEYAQLIALSQFLPGPGSSQIGFALGYHRQGIMGAMLAFCGFTLPSMMLMILLGHISSSFLGEVWFSALIHGLKLLAVVVVTDAIVGMYRSFCRQRITMLLCALSAIALLIWPSIQTQILVLIGAACLGTQYLKGPEQQTTKLAIQRIRYLPLGLLLFGLFVLPLFAPMAPALALFSDFFHAGSLVFGGGHVVLPLLQDLVGEQLNSDTFLTGYAGAQAVPGPMFTFATFLGYELLQEAPLLGAILATLAIFLPGFLLVLGVFHQWQALAQRPRLAGAIAALNAAVVGLLIAALYQPVFSSAVSNSLDMAMVLAGFVLLRGFKAPISALVGFFLLCGLATLWL